MSKHLIKNYLGFMLIAILLAQNSVHADELYKFAKITCAEEIGFIEISAVNIFNIGDFIWKYDPAAKKSYYNAKNIEYLKQAYGLYMGPKIKKDCRLAGKAARIEIEYDEPRASGMCGANPSAYLSLWVDGMPLIKYLSFHEDCLNDPSVHKISMRFYEESVYPVMNILLRLKDDSFHAYEIFSLDLKNKESLTMEYLHKKFLNKIERKK